MRPMDEAMIIGEIPDAIREGEIVLIPIGHGAWMKMFREDAIRRGLLPPDPEVKKREALPNKKRPPAANKGMGR